VPTDSGRPHEIYRCPSCEVAVWNVYSDISKLRFVRVGTLDEPAALAPDVHIYVRSKLPWVTLPEGIPSFAAYYGLSQALAPRQPGAPSRSYGVSSLKDMSASPPTTWLLVAVKGSGAMKIGIIASSSG
jgi:hypothetical protein